MEQSPSSEAVTQLDKKILAFYGNRRFITVFTTAHQWFLSRATCNHLGTTFL